MTPPDESTTDPNPEATETDGAAAQIEGHGGRLAAAALGAADVKHLFTLSGGHLFSLYDGCVKEKIELVFRETIDSSKAVLGN